MLYLVATPIGNLQDISFRAVDVLKNQVDIILCENTLYSQHLLREFSIQKPLKSYHQFNEKKRSEEIIDLLKQGKSAALISDAGTPGICDPGEEIITRCWAEHIPIRSIPGPSAWIVALSLCPLKNKKKVQFCGFLPKKTEEKKETLIDFLLYPGLSLFYESPHRILDTLAQINRCAPTSRLFLFRELTKLHEEHLQGTAKELLDHFQTHPVLGEFVVILEGNSFDYNALSPKEHVEMIQKNFEIDQRLAIRIVAELRTTPKREIYRQLLSKSI